MEEPPPPRPLPPVTLNFWGRSLPLGSSFMSLTCPGPVLLPLLASYHRRFVGLSVFLWGFAGGPSDGCPA